MDDKNIVISAKWVRLIKSPLYYVVAALTGVSVTFLPIGMYMLGSSHVEFWNPFVILCGLGIYIPTTFYFGLAAEVVRQVMKNGGTAATKDTNNDVWPPPPTSRS